MVLGKTENSCSEIVPGDQGNVTESTPLVMSSSAPRDRRIHSYAYTHTHTNTRTYMYTHTCHVSRYVTADTAGHLHPLMIVYRYRGAHLSLGTWGLPLYCHSNTAVVKFTIVIVA